MTAQEIFDQHQRARAQYESAGFSYSHPFGAMSLAEIQAHLDFCQQMSAEFHLNVDPSQMAGKSQSAIRAEMEARSKKHKRGAGYRALKRKVGEDAAKQIITKNR